MGVEPGADKAEVQGRRVRAGIVLSNCLLAVGLLSAGRVFQFLCGQQPAVLWVWPCL